MCTKFNCFGSSHYMLLRNQDILHPKVFWVLQKVVCKTHENSIHVGTRRLLDLSLAGDIVFFHQFDAPLHWRKAENENESVNAQQFRVFYHALCFMDKVAPRHIYKTLNCLCFRGLLHFQMFLESRLSSLLFLNWIDHTKTR